MSEPDYRNVWIAHYDESEVQHDARIGEAYALEEKATRSVGKHRAKTYVDLSQEEQKDQSRNGLDRAEADCMSMLLYSKRMSVTLGDVQWEWYYLCTYITQVSFAHGRMCGKSMVLPTSGA